MDIFISVILFVLGAMMGSFACCQVWRLKKGDKSKRSHCMHCKYQLRWYDNVPIFSWLFLRGRCRKCHKKIGCMEILSELAMGAVYLFSFLFWPAKASLMQGDAFEIAKFCIFLVLMLALAISFIYDLRWQELPLVSLYINIAIAGLFAVVSIAQRVVVAGFSAEIVWQMLGALMILPGLYFVMYKISHERWVGDGDWILNIALALALGDFMMATVAMFASNMLACLAFLPASLKKKDMEMRIPFGPFLILAFWLVYLAWPVLSGFFVL